MNATPQFNHPHPGPGCPLAGAEGEGMEFAPRLLSTVYRLLTAYHALATLHA